jgi:hypothetical protein
MTSQFAAHKALGTAVGSAAAVLAVLPGVAIFYDGVYAPPGYEKIFGAIITVVSTLALLLMTLYRRIIVDLEPKRVVQVTLGLCAIGLVALTAFSYARARAICPGPDNSEVYVLIFRPATVSAAGEQEDGVCRAVLAAPSPDPIMMEVRDSPGLVILSNAVFLFLYVIMNVATVAALSIAGWRVAADSRPERRPGADASKPQLASIQPPNHSDLAKEI